MPEHSENRGSIVISAFGGLGKSLFARKYPSLAIDLEAVPYKYHYTHPRHLEALPNSEHEGLKGITERSTNPNFPDNYVEAIKHSLGHYALVFIVLSPETLALLERDRIAYSIVYPDETLADELLERMRARGNDEHFIEKIRSTLATTTEKGMLRAHFHPEQFFTLGHQQHLEDLIARQYHNLRLDT